MSFTSQSFLLSLVRTEYCVHEFHFRSVEFSFNSVCRATVGFTSVTVPPFPVGRPRLDPGTLGVILPGAKRALTVQICWSNEVSRAPEDTETLPSLNVWLDELLDMGSYTGHANIRFEQFNGDLVEMSRKPET